MLWNMVVAKSFCHIISFSVSNLNDTSSALMSVFAGASPINSIKLARIPHELVATVKNLDVSFFCQTELNLVKRDVVVA